MPIIEIETELGTWKRREVTYQERRAIFMASRPEQRFVDSNNVFYIAHPQNLWCFISDEPLWTRYGS